MPSAQPYIIIQSICTQWTKTSRGGADATQRNRTPDAFKLPHLVPQSPDTGIIIQELAYGERDSFQHPSETLAQQKKTDPFRYNCLKLSSHENALNVLLEWESSEGVPRRFTLPRPGFSVPNGQWGRVIYNLRAAWEGCWIYKKYVLNIGLFSLPATEIFLETVPVHTHQDMAQLR